MVYEAIDLLYKQQVELQAQQQAQLDRIEVLTNTFDDKFKVEMDVGKVHVWGGSNRNIDIKVRSLKTGEILAVASVNAVRDDYREPFSCPKNTDRLLMGGLSRHAPKIMHDFNEYMKEKNMNIAFKKYLLNKTDEYLAKKHNEKFMR
ncbi:TPA: hypothetical protein ACGSUT_004825 [Vibrio parahaemolyticus]|nr:MULTISPECIES: hypothetical protein [Vibrio]AEX22390.1 hypothetical protein VEJY3_09550 [Vibrio sp. EJY3]EJA7356512.1 hypothetical protein [Vibrio parahaemolyticus]EJE4173838.1 hypothetical protein [Vibrio parahaemolyticus]EKH9202828.1 hypothetical protein [Vibrio parahaemolyticus]MCR9896601.1 hypothetical protein [Vibrio parahaemolyticus]|eukprot:Anaeramoba_flamelloidesa329107_139.p4 GENE.a329107_139~~a329107_139.p4  ORF type:complete len:147 (-),score=1.58 a329107_139:2603-3043(-)